MENSLDILAFSAHPDDAELGCGGALILSGEQGLSVAIADLSSGEKASRGSPDLRRAEIEAASDILKLKFRLGLGLPDTAIGQHSSHRLALIEVIRQHRPRIILAPYWHDRHPDHAATGRLVRAACYYAGVATVGTGQPHRPEQVFYYMLHQPFKPAFVLDISKVWSGKVAAVQAFSSQFRSDDAGPQTAISRPDFWRFVEARAIYYGGLVGAAYGEPFYSAGPVGLVKLPGLGCAPPPPGQLPAYKPYN
jgi:bacillithiol biosynthesis deacetylase BshB1